MLQVALKYNLVLTAMCYTRVPLAGGLEPGTPSTKGCERSLKSREGAAHARAGPRAENWPFRYLSPSSVV